MFSEDYEDELYQDEADSSLSDADSELQFHLYSQLHYSFENQDTKEAAREEESLIPQIPPQQKSLPPPAPVDVIVIDDGPDAITLSDNTEEDDSVCAKKGQKPPKRSLPQNTCSRAPSGSQTRSVSPDEIVVLDSESVQSSDSDSVPPFVEGQDSDSDSDKLETWMILGPEKHDVDHTIQLNCSLPDSFEDLEHVNDGGNLASWVVSDKDKQAQIYNKGVGQRRQSSRYYTNKSVTCRNCTKVGHLSKNCPTPKKLPCCSLCGHRGHLARTCRNRHCYNCLLPGHTFNECLERACWFKRCHRCGMSGHFNDSCPEIWRQYHLTTAPGPILKSLHPDACKTPAYCYNCSRKGHFGFECSDRRMYKGTFPTLPFISYYDNISDINCREHRLKKKVKEMQCAGTIYLPDDGAGSSTPRPPMKKRKTHNQQSPHGTSNQTNNSQTPKRRIAHTPKQHPIPHTQNTPWNINQIPQSPRIWGTDTPKSSFTPQEHSQMKAKRKKRKKKTKSAAIEENADFPRGGTQPTWDIRPPRTANNHPGLLFTKKSKKNKEAQTKKKERIWRKRQTNAAKDGVQYAPDNLFLIKQRKSR